MNKLTDADVCKYITDKLRDERGFQAIDAEDAILKLSKNRFEHRHIRRQAYEHAEDLAFWRIFIGEASWDGFLAEIYANGIGQRDVDAVKKVITTEYNKILKKFRAEMADDSSVVIIENVEEYSVKMDKETRSLVLTIKMRDGFPAPGKEGQL